MEFFPSLYYNIINNMTKFLPYFDIIHNNFQFCVIFFVRIWYITQFVILFQAEYHILIFGGISCMSRNRKLVGVILTHIENQEQQKLLDGILTTAFSCDYDVAIFSSFSKDKAKNSCHTEEKNIYTLINYDLFDAIIFVPDSFNNSELVKFLVAEIHDKFNGPAITIDTNSGESYFDYGRNAVNSINNVLTKETNSILTIENDTKSLKFINQTDDNFNLNFYSNFHDILEDLVVSNTLDECMNKISYYIDQVCEFDGFYLALCNNWDNINKQEDCKEYKVNSSYSSEMILPIIKNKLVKEETNKVFDSQTMLPQLFLPHEKPTAFYLTPLQFREFCFGYSVISYENRVQTYPVAYRQFMSFINTALSNLSLKNYTLYTQDKIETLLKKDPLTGLYNQAYYLECKDTILNIAKDKNKKLLIIMGDLNHLAQINEDFGHMEGDNAIRECSRAFLTVGKDNDMCFRYGGGIFLLLGYGDYEDTVVDDYVNNINCCINYYNESSGKPYQISVRLGIWCDLPEKDKPLEYYITIADQNLLVSKLREKFLKNQFLV